MWYSPLRHRRAVAAAVLILAACGDDGTTPQPLTLTLSSTSVTLEELETVQLSADVGGPTGTTVSWTSSDTDVATVDAQGRVTGVAAGGATVTATATVDGQSAQGSTAVTVTPLPLAIAVDRFVENGAPVPADRLGIGVSAEVVYDAPAHFEGFIEVLAGDEVLGRIAVPGAEAAGPSTASEVVVTALQGARAEVPVNVTALRDGMIRPLVTNDVSTGLRARIGGGTGAPVESATTTASFQISPRFAITSIEASRSALGPAGKTWIGGPSPLVVLNGRIVDFSAIPTDLSGDVTVTVLKDASATMLYGAAAANGVVQITLRDELADQEGEYRFGAQAAWAGGGEAVPVLNATDLGAARLGLPTGFHWDAAAAVFAEPAFPAELWFQPGTVLPQLEDRFGFGPGSFADGGVGGVQFELRAGTTPDLEFGPIEEFEDAYLAFAAGWLLGADVTDDLDNFKRWVFSRQGTPVRIGVDPTPPAAPVFATGPNFTVPGAINPQSLFFAWSATDPDPGSGIDPSAYRISFEWSSPSAGECLIGFGTGCAPVQAPEGAQDGWSPEGVPAGISAEFRLGVGASDLATNLGDLAYADWVLDALPVQGAGTPVVGAPSDGDLPLSGFQLVDDLELAYTGVVVQYSMGAQVPIYPMYLASQRVGTPFDGTFQTMAEMAYMPHLVSLETTDPSHRPTGTIYPLSAVTVVGGDHAGHAATVSTTAPGVEPRSTSFRTAGMNRFAFRTAPGTICNPTPSNGAGCNGAPTSVDVVVEAFSEGSFEIDEVMLVGAQSDPGNPIGLADWTDLVVMDQGTLEEGTAIFTLDGAALQLAEGFLDVWAIARAADGGGVLSRKVRYSVVF